MLGLIIINNFITRENKNNGTEIDLIATNDNHLKCFPLNDEIISDHKTIMLKMVKNNESKPVKNDIISWKQYTKENLINNLRNCDWSRFYNIPLDAKVQLIRDNLFNSVYPLTKIVQIRNNIKPKPWFNDEIKQLKCKNSIAI